MATESQPPDPKKDRPSVSLDIKESNTGVPPLCSLISSDCDEENGPKGKC